MYSLWGLVKSFKNKSYNPTNKGCLIVLIQANHGYFGSTFLPFQLLVICVCKWPYCSFFSCKYWSFTFSRFFAKKRKKRKWLRDNKIQSIHSLCLSLFKLVVSLLLSIFMLLFPSSLLSFSFVCLSFSFHSYTMFLFKA